MATKVHYRRFAKIAPDPQRPSQQIRIRFDPSDPQSAPILQLLDECQHGQLRRAIAQALRVASAAHLGQPPLSPPETKPNRPLGGRRFAPVRRDVATMGTREDLFTWYDPREPWNSHIETILARCEWGETNKTMLELLLHGLRAMGYTRAGPGAASQAAAAQPAAGSAASQETELKAADFMQRPPRD